MSDIKQSEVETFQRCFPRNPGKFCTLFNKGGRLRVTSILLTIDKINALIPNVINALSVPVERDGNIHISIDKPDTNKFKTASLYQT